MISQRSIRFTVSQAINVRRELFICGMRSRQLFGRTQHLGPDSKKLRVAIQGYLYISATFATFIKMTGNREQVGGRELAPAIMQDLVLSQMIAQMLSPQPRSRLYSHIISC